MIPLPTPHLALFGMSGSAEIGFLILLVFLLFGAKKIPELMRSLGRAQGEYQKAKKDFEKEVKSVESGEATATGEGVVFTPYKELDKARNKAKELGLETEGKDLAALNEAIAKKVGGPTA